jgi:shikimate kinase
MSAGLARSSVYLVGMPGSGKSTVGRLLARRLEMEFFDADQVLEKRLGCSIREYFEQLGEQVFRDREEAVIAELTRLRGVVVSTGGGVVLRAQNRQHLHQRGWVVYLKSNPDDLYRRLRHDQSRPLLQVADPLAQLKDLHAVRDPLYREVAHCTIATGRPLVNAVVQNIAMQFEQQELNPSGH